MNGEELRGEREGGFFWGGVKCEVMVLGFREGEGGCFFVGEEGLGIWG